MIIFVRHGQTAVNREGRFQGRLDAPLTDLGRSQSALVAAQLAASGAELVLTSPLLRASQTAHAIADAVGAPVDSDDRLLEIAYGEWDGLKLSDVSAGEWEAWRRDPSFTPPGGESLLAVAARTADFCAERLDADRVVVAVSHVSPIKAAIAWALGVGTEVTWRMHLDVASISRIAIRGSGPALLASYNETAHLHA